MCQTRFDEKEILCVKNVFSSDMFIPWKDAEKIWIPNMRKPRVLNKGWVPSSEQGFIYNEQSDLGVWTDLKRFIRPEFGTELNQDFEVPYTGREDPEWGPNFERHCSRIKAPEIELNWKILIEEEMGLDVYVYDEMFTQDEIKQMNLKYANPHDADIVFDSFQLKFEKTDI